MISDDLLYFIDGILTERNKLRDELNEAKLLIIALRERNSDLERDLENAIADSEDYKWRYGEP